MLGEGRLLAPEQAVVVEPAADVARERARAHLATYLALPNYTNNFRRLGFTDDDLADRGATASWARSWRGAMRRRCWRVQEHRDAGADQVVLQVLGPEMTALPMADLRAGGGARVALREAVRPAWPGNAVEACVAGERSRGLRGRGTQ